MASIHQTAEGLRGAGVMDKQAMRMFDEACLMPLRALSPEEILGLLISSRALSRKSSLWQTGLTRCHPDRRRRGVRCRMGVASRLTAFATSA